MLVYYYNIHMSFQNTRILEGLLKATVMQILLLTTTLPY